MSDMTQTAWCKANNINLNTFKYWKKRLQLSKNTPEPESRFIPLKPIQEITCAPIVLKTGQIVLDIYKGADVQLLDDVLSVLVRHV